MVFDCTDANSALINSKIFMDQGIKVIDLTPSNIGTMYIPYITPISDYMNMVTCGGQSSIPLINFIHKQCSDIKYIEVVTQISAESAGMATRINIDKYIETTENAIYNLTGLKNNKVIGYLFAIKTIDDKFIGTLGLDYTKEKMNLSQKSINELERHASLLGGVLMSY